MLTAKRNNGSSVSHTTRLFVRRPPGLSWQMIHQYIWKLNNTLFIAAYWSPTICSLVNKKEWDVWCKVLQIKQCKQEMPYHWGCEINWLKEKKKKEKKISLPNSVICIKTSPSLSSLHLPTWDRTNVVIYNLSFFFQLDHDTQATNSCWLQPSTTWQNRTIQLPRTTVTG